MLMLVHCTKCKAGFELEVQQADYDAWRGGALIQRVMPYLSIGDRELLISGICGPCFDTMFRGTDEG